MILHSRLLWSTSSLFLLDFRPSLSMLQLRKFSILCIHMFFNQMSKTCEILTGKPDIRIPFWINVLSLWAVFRYTFKALASRAQGPWFESPREGGNFFPVCFIFTCYITILFNYMITYTVTVDEINCWFWPVMTIAMQRTVVYV